MKARATVKDAGKSDLDTMQEFMMDERDSPRFLSYLMEEDVKPKADKVKVSQVF